MSSSESFAQPQTLIKPVDSAGLAIHGGPATMTGPEPELVRWGAAELELLTQATEQSSLFYWNGPQTRLLIERFQEAYPFEYVMPCSSGTASIHIALAAAGIGPGDEVITSPITDMGTVIGILYQQGVPVFADVEAHTYNLDVEAVAEAITPRTRAILAVHLAGNPCRLDALRALADEHKLILIEDCAQAWGARSAGRPVGSVGQIGCYSLNDFKHISCGEGGIVATNDKRFGPLLRLYGDKGYQRGGARLPEMLAPNYRIGELQSAFAAAQLSRIESLATRREALGSLLTRRVTSLDGLHPHQVSPDDFCSYWFYLLRLDPARFSCSRDEFSAALAAEGVSCRGSYISHPIYQYPVFQNRNFFAGRWPILDLGLTSMDYKTVCCPEAEAILEDCIFVALHQGMDEEWIDGISQALEKVARFYRRDSFREGEPNSK